MNITRYRYFAYAFCAIALASCDTSSIAPNAGDLSKSKDNDVLTTDKEFSPNIVAITPFEVCKLGNEDKVTSDCRTYDKVTDKEWFDKSAIRFLLAFDKHVHYENAKQGRIVLENAAFAAQGVAEFLVQPVTLEETIDDKTGKKQTKFEEVRNADSSSKFKYFTTRSEIGAIIPHRPTNSQVDEGGFSITIPSGMFYDVNPNNKKIGNIGKSASYHYDNIPPNPIISFDVQQMNLDPEGYMSSSSNDLNGRGLNFSRIEMVVDFGEPVTPVGSITDMLDPNKNSNKDNLLIKIGCQPRTADTCNPPYNSGKLVGTNTREPENGAQYVSVKEGSNNSKYVFLLFENDTTGDNLVKLLGAGKLTFIVKPIAFEDRAGNTGVDSEGNPLQVTRDVTVINERPQITTINMALQGEKKIGTTRVMGIGSYIDFQVQYENLVTITNYKEYGVQFDFGPGQRNVAELVPSQQKLRDYRLDWTFRYTIKTHDGSNAIGISVPGTKEFDVPGQQFLGDATKKGGLTKKSDWTSDISFLFGMSSNFAYNQVLQPADEFTDREFSSQNKVFDAAQGLNIDTFFHDLHVDGVRPVIDTQIIDSLSKVMSGNVGETSTVVVQNKKLAVVVPFSETIRYHGTDNTNDVDIDFSSMSGDNPLLNAFVSVDYCSNVASSRDNCKKAGSVQLAYDKDLTEQARLTSRLSSYKYRSLVFSTIISGGNISGIKSVIAYDVQYAANSNSVPITNFSDRAGNKFASSGLIDTNIFKGFKFSSPISISIDSSAFSVQKINMVRYNSGGTYTTIPDSSTDINRINSVDNNLFIELVINKNLRTSSIPIDAATLKVEIDRLDGGKTQVASKAVFMKREKGSISPELNKLLFQFDLSSQSIGGIELNDNDGIKVVEFDIKDENKDYFRTSNSVVLNTGLDGVPVSPILVGSRLHIDMDPPECASIYITNSSDNKAPSGVISFGTKRNYSSSISLVLQCDQELVYNPSFHSGEETKPFVPIKFGTLQFAMSDSTIDIIDGTYSVVYNFDLVPGIPSKGRSENEYLLVGHKNNKTINMHSVNGQLAGDQVKDHQFFTDVNKNPLNLSFNLKNVAGSSDSYLLKYLINLPEDNPTQSDADIVVDTRPFASNIIYPALSSVVLANNYQEGTIRWLNGNVLTRTNRLNFDVKYVYYYKDRTEDAIISLAGGTSGQFITPANVNLFPFSPFSSSGPLVTYSGSLGYGVLSDVTVDHISQGLTNYSQDTAPYQTFNVSVYNDNGKEISEQDLVKIPVHPSFVGTDQNEFPNLKVNNTRPVVNSLDLFALNGTNYTKLPVAPSANPDINYGSIFVVIAFSKKMREENLNNTYVELHTKSGGKDLTVDTVDIVFVARAGLPASLKSNIVDIEKTLVYKFGYEKPLYSGNGMILNKSGGVPIKTDIAGSLSNVQDIYGNEYEVANRSKKEYATPLTAVSNIESVSFIGSQPYKYGDTIKVAVVTDKQINSSGVSSNLALALKLELKHDESVSGASAKTIVASALKSAIDNNVIPNKTKITFSYSLVGLDNQFNADTKADFGIQAFGNILLCQADDVTTDCGKFATSTIDGLGRDTGPATLSVVRPLAADRGQAQSVLNRLILTDENNFTSSGIFHSFKYKESGKTNIQDVASGTVLKTDDTLFFTLPFALVNEVKGGKTFAQNALSGSSSDTKLEFSIFNGSNSQRVTRQADFHGVDTANQNVALFSYQVQSGDLVHIKSSVSTIVPYNDIGGADISGDDLAIRIKTGELFTEIFQIDGITDSIFGNALWAQVVDSSNNVQAVTMNVSGDELTIDTRPSITGATIQGGALKVKAGDTVDFLLTYNEGIYTSGTGIKLILTDSNNLDVTADLKASNLGSRSQLTFSFVVPDALIHPVRVKSVVTGNGRISFEEGNGNATLLSVNNEIASSIAIADLQIDNTRPQVISVGLVDASGNAASGGIFSAVNGKEKVYIKFTLDKDVTFTGLSTADALRMLVKLDQYADMQTTSYSFNVNTGSVTARSFVLMLDVSNNVANNIQDYDGLRLASDTLLLAGTAIDANTGNNMQLRFGSSVKKQIEDLDVSIDTKTPFIKNINFNPSTHSITPSTLTRDCNGSNTLCAGASAQVEVDVEFSEDIRFTNTTASNYKLLVASDNNDISFDFIPVSPSTTAYVSTQTFSITVPSDKVFNNKLFNRELISSSFKISGAEVQDRGQNAFADTHLIELTGKTNIAGLSIDSRTPKVTSVDLDIGEYGNDSDIPIIVKYDKDVTVDKTPDIASTFYEKMSDSTGTSKVFNFSGYKQLGGVDDLTSVLFAFTVDKNNDSNEYDAVQRGNVIIPNGGSIKDMYGNTASYALPTASKKAVQVRPNASATVKGVTVYKDTQPVATTGDGVIFQKDQEIIIKVEYDRAVDFQSVTTPTSSVYIQFSVNSPANGVIKAYYKEGIQTDTLVFVYKVASGVEDNNGIELRNTGIVLPSGGKLVILGDTQEVPISLQNKFANDKIGNDNILETVKIDTLIPEPLRGAEFTNIQVSAAHVRTTLSLTKGVTRQADVVKYLIYLYNNDTNSQYIIGSTLPSNVDYPGALSVVYAEPTIAGGTLVDLTVDRAMVAGVCDRVYARVYPVDQVNQKHYLSARTSNTIYFNTVPPIIATQSASGTSQYPIFDKIGNYPRLDGFTVSNQCNDTSDDFMFQYAITYVDATGDTQYLEPTSDKLGYSAFISKYADLNLDTTKLARLTPFHIYTTTFIVSDTLHNVATKAHKWQAFTKSMPIRYDFSDDSSVTVAAGQMILRVDNLGSGETIVTDSSTITRNPGLWNLQSIVSVNARDNGYFNRAPMYDSANKAALFESSTTHRSNLYFDNDLRDGTADTGTSERVNLSNGIALYMVFTPPGYAVNSNQRINVHNTLEKYSNSFYYPMLFFAAGGYFSSNNLDITGGNNRVPSNNTALGTDNYSIAANVYQQNLQDLHTMSIRNNKNTYTYTDPWLYTNSKRIVVHQITDLAPGNDTYRMCTYVDNTGDCSSGENITLSEGMQIDKLYIGGLPYSISGKFDPLNRFFGHNISGAKLHELIIYDGTHDSSLSRSDANGRNTRQFITEHLAKKWGVVLARPSNVISEPELFPAGVFPADSTTDLLNQRNRVTTRVNNQPLTCMYGADTTADITFPPIALKIPTNTVMHLLIQQDRAGNLASNTSYFLAANISVNAGDVTIDAVNDGNGVFSYKLNKASMGGTVVKPWEGLCHAGGENVYTYAAYFTRTNLTLPTDPATIDTVEEFEKTFSEQIEYKSAKKLTFRRSGAGFASYALRQFFGEYQGPAITVSTGTSGTDPTKDIYFVDPSGDLDVAALTTFATANSVTDLYVTRWYDQSGNNRHLYAVSSTEGGGSSPYPKIYKSGSVIENSISQYPTIEFDGGYLTYDLDGPHPDVKFAVFVRATYTYNTTHQWSDKYNNSLFDFGNPGAFAYNTVYHSLGDRTRWFLTNKIIKHRSISPGVGVVTQNRLASFSFFSDWNSKSAQRGVDSLIGRLTLSNTLTQVLHAVTPRVSQYPFNEIRMGSNSRNFQIDYFMLFLNDIYTEAFTRAAADQTTRTAPNPKMSLYETYGFTRAGHK